jgi:hypothetical protein
MKLSSRYFFRPQAKVTFPDLAVDVAARRFFIFGAGPHLIQERRSIAPEAVSAPAPPRLREVASVLPPVERTSPSFTHQNSFQHQLIRTIQSCNHIA